MASEAPDVASVVTQTQDNSSQQSTTAKDYITQQLQLEADAREALPYQFDSCTKPLGALRQAIFACLTCTPPPASIHQVHTPAGVCYSCSISCHGEHELVELFTKRNFTCDCGTTRMANGGTPCSLRTNATGQKGGVVDEPAANGNEYNHNFKGNFCACGETYDPEKEKGTMFQCLGLGSLQDGGCGEDWWHPECLLGLPRTQQEAVQKVEQQKGILETVKEEAETSDLGGEVPVETREIDEHPLPEGFPDEDDFDHLICYKCTTAFPWIKAYAGTTGFLPAVAHSNTKSEPTSSEAPSMSTNSPKLIANGSNKRKLEDDEEEVSVTKRARSEDAEQDSSNTVAEPTQEPVTIHKHERLPKSTSDSISLFVKEDFREHFCRCAECFPRLAQHPQLLDEEDTYEPPISESGEEADQQSLAGRSVNSGSLLDRGEAALSSMDRVRALEGVMAYNHMRDKVKAFLAPFAESGEMIKAEDVKSYFAKLRGDEQAIREAAISVQEGGSRDHRREQGGY